MAGITRYEQETIIRWNEEEAEVFIYSASPVTWRKCGRLGLRMAKSAKWRDGSESGRWYTVPKAMFRWGLKRGGSVSPERRAAATARLEAARARRAEGRESPDGAQT
jgi:hypothetical protein